MRPLEALHLGFIKEVLHVEVMGILKEGGGGRGAPLEQTIDTGSTVCIKLCLNTKLN